TRPGPGVEALALPWLHVLLQWLVEDAPSDAEGPRAVPGPRLRWSCPTGRSRATESSRLAIKIKATGTAKHRAIVLAKQRCAAAPEAASLPTQFRASTDPTPP